MNNTRREFLRTSLAAASLVAVPTFVPRSVFADGKRPGANDRIGIAGIGVGRQGEPIFRDAAKDARTQAVAVCDVWKSRAADVAKKVGVTKEDAIVQDYRRIIERGDVDAILTATPEHWRSLICVNAALAGKHLYIEKPITLTINDGVLMRRAARKTGVTVQCGSMQRSYRVNHLACQFIREGHLGKISEVIAANYESPWLMTLPAETVPEGLDWEMWCGPVEPVPFNKELFVPRGNPGWLSIRNYSGGEMTGWGTHGFDQIQYALSRDESGPVEIIVEGEKLSPPTYTAPESRARGDKLCSQPRLKFRYNDGLTVTLGDADRGGGTFIGENGKVEIARNKFVSTPKELAENWLKSHESFNMPSHMTNWIDCIYSGERPIGELETGLRTAGLCHILSIARYLGHNLKWDPAAEKFTGDDNSTAAANALLARTHRKGYELPEV
ncbi:MAG: Gfo/Idh/MocA family protein [Thermoguttaceae bacterium]